MVHNHLQRALSLARRTGDRLLVVDRYDENDSYVVMGMDEYERLVDAAEENEADFYPEMDEMEDIEDIEENEDEDEWFGPDDNFDTDISQEDDEIPEIADFEPLENHELDNTPEYGRINDAFETEIPQPKKARKRWQIPAEVKRAGEEVVSPEEAFSGEEAQSDDDRYYLETI